LLFIDQGKGSQLGWNSGKENASVLNSSSMSTAQFSSFVMPDASGVFRAPFRHELTRDDSFEDKFDYQTLFYDVFWSQDGLDVICIGPPFHFPDHDLDELSAHALPSGERCTLVHDRLAGRPLNGRSRFRARLPKGSTGLDVSFGNVRQILAIQPNLSSLFLDQKIIVTTTQNNKIEWIVDWINFHSERYSIRNYILVSNNETAYDINQYLYAIQRFCNLDHCLVVAAPFPYGPLSLKKFGGRRDSNFLQVALYDIALQRFGCSAKAMINLDIDELLIADDGRRLDQLVSDPEFRSALIPRYNAYHDPALLDRPPRHADHDRISFKHAILPKWVVNPQSMRGLDQLHVHDVIGHERQLLPRAEIYIAHCHGIGTGWNNPLRTGAAPASGSSVKTDKALHKILERSFRNIPAASDLAWHSQRITTPDMLKRAALKAERSGNVEEARALVGRINELTADYFPIAALRHRLAGDPEIAEALLAQTARTRYPAFFQLMFEKSISEADYAEAQRWVREGLERFPDHEDLRTLDRRLARLKAGKLSAM